MTYCDHDLNVAPNGKLATCPKCSGVFVYRDGMWANAAHLGSIAASDADRLEADLITALKNQQTLVPISGQMINFWLDDDGSILVRVVTMRDGTEHEERGELSAGTVAFGIKYMVRLAAERLMQQMQREKGTPANGAPTT